jgi:hypothetical protein
VFVNETENQTSLDYYTAFTIWFDGMADPVRVDPQGRFVRLTLPSGEYRVSRIQLYIPATQMNNNLGAPAPFSLTVTPGARTLFPYALVTRMLKGTVPGSFRPIMQPRALAANERAALEQELAAAASAGKLGPARTLAEASQAQALIPTDTARPAAPAPVGPPGELVFVNDVTDPDHRGFPLAFLVFLEGRDAPVKIDQAMRFVRVSLPSGTWRVTHVAEYQASTNDRWPSPDLAAPFVFTVPPGGQVVFPYRFVSQSSPASRTGPVYLARPFTAAELNAVQAEIGQVTAKAGDQAPPVRSLDELSTPLGLQVVSGPLTPDAAPGAGGGTPSAGGGTASAGGGTPAAGDAVGEVAFVNDVANTSGSDFYTAWLIYLEGRPKPLKIDPTSHYVRLRLPPGDYRVTKVGLYTTELNDLAQVRTEVKPFTLTVQAGRQVIFPWQLVTRMLATKGGGFEMAFRVTLMPPTVASAAQADLRQSLLSDPSAVPARTPEQLTPTLGAMTASIVAQLPANLAPASPVQPANPSAAPTAAVPAAPAAAAPAAPAASAVPAGPPGELVFTNELEHPPGLDFYTAYLVFLAGLADPVRVDPSGRFVRVNLPSGDWQVTAVALYRPSDGNVLSYMRDIAPFTLSIKPGERTLFPYRFITRLEGTPQSYRPIFQVPALNASEQASLATELDQVIGANSSQAPEVRPMADLAQKLAAARPPSDAVLAQDTVPFLRFAAEQGIQRPERYQGDPGEFLFPRVTVTDRGARTVSLGGYLPRTGGVTIDWGDGAYGGALNGSYKAAGLIHQYAGSAPVFRILVRWDPLKADEQLTALFVDLSAHPWLPNAEKATRAVVGGHTGLSITDGLVQVIDPDIDGAINHTTIAGAPAFKFVKDLFGDGFQFILIFPLHHVGDMPPGISSAMSQPASGLGFGPFKGGVGGTIQEVSRMALYTSLAIAWPLLMHEMFHNYGNGIIPSADAAHWGYSSVNGLIGGFNPATLVNLGNNRWRAATFRTNHNPNNAFGDLELYLMGLAPASEVKPIQYFESAEMVSNDNTGVVFQARAASRTVTIQELVAAKGPRLPAWPNAPRDFRAINILLTDVELSPVELEPYLESIHWLTFDTPLTLDSDMRNFQAMTKGRGFLHMEGLLKAFRTNQ